MRAASDSMLDSPTEILARLSGAQGLGMTPESVESTRHLHDPLHPKGPSPLVAPKVALVIT
jgi:hypothetical protein